MAPSQRYDFLDEHIGTVVEKYTIDAPSLKDVPTSLRYIRNDLPIVTSIFLLYISTGYTEHCVTLLSVA